MDKNRLCLKGRLVQMKYYLAIDIGASSGRHILGHVEDGRMVTEEIYRFANSPRTVTEGGRRSLRWDIDALRREILAGLRRAGELGRVPYSIGIDTWGVDYVLLDSCDRVIDGAYCYRDSRTDESMARALELIPFERLYELTGIQHAKINTVFQLYADKLSGRLDGARRFLMLPDYFHFLLTGKKANEYTNSTTTGLLDARTHTWSDEILGALGIDRAIFGEPLQPGTFLGELSDEVAREVGYRARVILPATHDTASAVLAAPLGAAPSPYISSGTWSLLGIERPQAETGRAALESNYSNEGSLGGSFRLQKNIMGLWMIQQVRRELAERGEEYSFAELESLARASVTDARVDVDDQRFLAPESMIGELEDALGRSLSVGEMAYCIFASLAEGYAKSLDDLSGITGERFETLNIIGGGSKNGLLNELSAASTGLRIITGPTEGTAIGNLMLQMIGAGELSDVATGRALVRNSFDIKTLDL